MNLLKKLFGEKDGEKVAVHLRNGVVYCSPDTTAREIIAVAGNFAPRHLSSPQGKGRVMEQHEINDLKRAMGHGVR